MHFLHINANMLQRSVVKKKCLLIFILILTVNLWSVSLVKGQEEPQIQGWYSKEYNEYEPNTASIYSTEIKKSTTFVWVLYPSEHLLSGIKTKIQSEDKDMVTLQIINPQEGSWMIKIPLLNSSKASCKFSLR